MIMDWVELLTSKPTVTLHFRNPENNGLDSEETLKLPKDALTKISKMAETQLNNENFKDSREIHIPFITLKEFKLLLNFYLNLSAAAASSDSNDKRLSFWSTFTKEELKRFRQWREYMMIQEELANKDQLDIHCLKSSFCVSEWKKIASVPVRGFINHILHQHVIIFVDCVQDLNIFDLITKEHTIIELEHNCENFVHLENNLFAFGCHAYISIIDVLKKKRVFGNIYGGPFCFPEHTTANFNLISDDLIYQKISDTIFIKHLKTEEEIANIPLPHLDPNNSSAISVNSCRVFYCYRTENLYAAFHYCQNSRWHYVIYEASVTYDES